jgi:hypothetical protein
MPAQNNSRVAGGTIQIASFIQGNPGVQLGALQCSGAGVEILGIAQEFTNAMMGQALAPAQGFPAATVGQHIRVYGDGEETVVIVGSGYTIMPDNLLTSDGSGFAIPITLGATTQWIGARAIEAGLPGDPIRVTVVLRPPYKVT